MVTPIDDAAHIIAAIYDGPFEDALWQGFLNALRRRMRASYASLIFRPLDGTPGKLIELCSGAASPPHLKQLYFEQLYKRDPLPYHQYRNDQIYSTADLLDPADPVHRAFLKDLLIPSGMACLRTMRVTEESGVGAWLSVARSGPDFRCEDDALIASLAPHLRRALRSFVAIEREQFKARMAANAIRRLNYGWVAVDAKAQIVDQDQHTATLLEQVSAFRSTGGRLALADSSLDRRFRMTLDLIADDAGARPHALTVSRDPWIDMLLVPVQHRQIASSARPVAIVYVHADSRSTANRSEQLTDLFGLLPSEARLALALSRGLSIADAANALGLTVETARNYSKKIYAKTGARGQSELIRFILASTLALA
ncbi:helix-turn-helix transcriptional regulator [Sphingomonas crocodyli]|uniref:Helix-turn-helix transcriptional regulator n=1 Tax=Sphingomonas crocodyli TaxID=1979270 RepID=A0A437M6A1_9SPHN|nr:helix-turn-helix transcriptional regulator [Sphingomonas crocodyli]RVT93113.1 helix-turn-helix transcriptional regulator [Sphingomonas crocodyli]